MRHKFSLRDQYINKTFAQESFHLLKIKEALAKNDKQGIHISPYEGRLLSFWIQVLQAKDIIEVGTLYGYSTLWMAQALPKGGKIISLEKNPEYHQKAQKLLEPTPQWNRIELLLGEAPDLLSQLHGMYDMIFIDADKAGYMTYLRWADEHIRPGGFIVGDNTLLFGHLIGEGQSQVSQKQLKAIQQFNQHLSNHKKYEAVMIPTWEGMTVAMKK